MKKLFALLFLTLFALSISVPTDAEARRFGGGSSFGKQRMFNQPSRATPQKATPIQRTTPRNGFGGILAGLALGGLLGALFFGGAFEGINLFDIIVLGTIAYLLLGFFRRKAQSMHVAQYASQPPFGAQPVQFEATDSAQAASSRVEIDPAYFTSAAKDIFVRMQKAWDAKDISEIRTFCSPEVSERIERDLAELGDTVTATEVVMLDADIMDTWQENGFDYVAVNFQAMIKEAENSTTTDTSVREIWIFRHERKSDDPTWFLAGIQQMG